MRGLDMNNIKLKDYIFLHSILLLYSLGAIFSKLASANDFLSVRFCLFYGAVLMVLVLYAVLWQQVLKKIPLTTAFANKSITVIWGMILGRILFDEKISIGNMIGSAIILIGIYLVVTEKNES